MTAVVQGGDDRWAARAASWAALDWTKDVGLDEAIPVSHYPQLAEGPFDAAQKSALAHFMSCFTCELFVHFEGYLIDYLRRHPERVVMLSPRTMESFVAEEQLHTDAFRKLLMKLRPDLYPQGQPRFLRRRRSEDRVLSCLPATTFFLLALLFEEITLFVPQALRAETRCSPLLKSVMELHARDEQAHVGLDARALLELSRSGWRGARSLEVLACLPALWFVDQQIARGWRSAVRQVAAELSLDSEQTRYLLRREPSLSDRWGGESFVAKLANLSLPCAPLLASVLSAQLASGPRVLVEE